MITLLNKKRNLQKIRENLKEKLRVKLREKKQEMNEKKEKIQKNNELINNYNQLNKPFLLKSSYNSIIPLHLYTCWHTKDLPPLMRKNYDYLVESNPKITFHLYDEQDCRQFIQENFDSEVLNAYNSLIPCAYKSDLWRVCVLYINGGIYMDIKYRCANGFKFIDLTEKEYFVRDYNTNNVYNALIVTLPKNEIMLKCINQIVENVKNKNYGSDCLDPTGPTLLGKFFTQENKNSFEMYHSFTSIEDKINEYYVVKEDRIILKIYKEYREEQKNNQKNKYYADLWEERNIYHN